MTAAPDPGELVQLEIPIPGLPADEVDTPTHAERGRRAAARRAHTAPPPASSAAAFAAKLVELPTGCRIFTGAISTPDGYGRVTITSRDDTGKAIPLTISAHRFALWQHAGELAAEGVLEHHCNEPLCVRIDDNHVHASTQSANLHHAIVTGRHHNSETIVDSTRRAEISRAVRAIALHYRDTAQFDPEKYRQLRHTTETAPTLPLW